MPIDRRGWGLDWQPGLKPGVAPNVGHLLAELLHTTGDHVLDILGRDPGAGDDLGVATAEQLVRMYVLVVALLLVTAPDRGPDCFYDHYLATMFSRHLLLLVFHSTVSLELAMAPTNTNG
jgi:hypothetical protein